MAQLNMDHRFKCDHKLDWSLGVSGDAAGLTFGVAYVDSSRTSRDPQGKPTIVGSISKSF